MDTERNLTERRNEPPHCPQCDGVELRRHGRVGLWQRHVLPRLGLYPWECGLCRKIFYLRLRSRGYRASTAAVSKPQPPASGRLGFVPPSPAPIERTPPQKKVLP